MKPVVISDKRDEFESRNILEKRFLIENLYYENSDTTNKINGFSALCCSANVFQTEFMMEELEHVVPEQYKFEKGAIKK